MSAARSEMRPGGPGGQAGPGSPGGQGGRGYMGGGPMAGFGMPVQKPKNFKATFRRLIGYFLPYKYRLLIIFVAAVIGTVFNIIGPKILGLATTKLFEGILLKLRHVPGAAVDF